jgi:uncharacterized membrane protein
VSTARLEAFSDGVLAIAVTLLVLDIRVPDPSGHGSLAHRLGTEWPHYTAYAVSFLTIGVIWINHHAMVRRMARADHTVLVLNLVLLLTIGLLPFTTALMAEYVQRSSGEHLAAAIYAGSFLVMALAFFSMQRYLLYGSSNLAADRIDERLRRRIAWRNFAGLVPYALAVAVAPLSSYATLILCGAVALFYALPQTTADA